MHITPAPEPRDLLPPLLACLPTTFVSPRPPPALLPLLAPVLRQRANFLAASSTNTSDGWVRLLSWDSQRAAKLPSIVEHLELEPHPVSGEVEIEDVQAIKYRRLDEETLHARLEAVQFDLAPTYVWCATDEHGGTGPGWKLTELKSLEDLEDGETWYETASQAEDAASAQSIDMPEANGSSPSQPVVQAQQPEEEDDDDQDDYWNQYDRTPSQTPGPAKRSPVPQATTSASQSATRARTQSEVEYFARYGSEVQPALDAHDPDEDHPEIGRSTLNGSTQRTRSTQPQVTQSNAETDDRPSWEKALYPHARSGAHDSAIATALDQSPQASISMPRPISPTSSHSSVERLEERAAAMNDHSDSGNDRAESAVRQHIATDLKSLFRLARSVGMEKSEFERAVRTELDMLGFMERDE